MPELKNTMRLPIEEGPHGVYDVVDEALDGKKAIPIVFVSKTSGDASFEYGSKATADGSLRNKMSQPIESDAEGNTRVVDEDVDGQKAIPLVAVTKDADGKFVYAEIGGQPDPGSVTTDTIEDGAVTDAKLANPKVSKAGDTMTGPIVFADPNNRSKLILTKYPGGTGHNNAPTTFDLSSVYLHLGGTEYNANSYRLIGFGYRRSEDSSHAAAVIGYQETSSSADDMGRLLFATRNVTTDTAPTVRMTIEPDGQVLLESGYVPGSDDAVPNKKYVDDAVASATPADGSVTTAKFAADAKAPLAGTADSANAVDAADVSGTLAAAQIPTLDQSKITNLTADLAAKLTATQAAAQADSTATDVAGLVADLNTLLGNLRTAGIIAT